VNKKILKIAIPNIISNLTIPLLGIVDLSLMGHLSKVDFIGAIAIGAMIFNFLYWTFAFLRMGTSGLTAQAYGSRDLNETSYSLIRALSVAIIAALFIIILQVPIAKASFYFINSEASVENLASSYFFIRVWAAPATLMLYALMGWFIGMQNSRFPMLVAIIGNITNMLLSYIFVYKFDMDVRGVALGTVLSQYISLFIALGLCYKFYSKIFRKWNTKIIFKLESLKKFVTLNRDIFLRTLCIIFVFTFFTSESASTNKTTLAVNTILLQFLFIFSYFMDGFAFAGEALVGKYKGAHNLNLFRKVNRHLFIWGFAISIIFTIIYSSGAGLILKLFTNNLNTIQSAQDYLIWISILPILSFASFIFDGIYIGATASVYMRKTMMYATILVFIPCYFFLKSSMLNHGLWIAMLAFMASRGIFQAIFYNKAIIKQFSSR